MKRLSRLTALLLAFMMFMTMFAYAEEGVPQSELNAETYNTMLSDVQTYGLIDEAYEHYVEELAALDIDARYAKLVSWHDGLLGNVFYAKFISYYKTAHAGEGLICTCAAPIEYGTLEHDADCGWHFANLDSADQATIVDGLTEAEREEYLANLSTAERTVADEATGLSVSGELPEGAVVSVEILSAGDELSAIMDTDTDITGYNIKVLWNGYEWQPGSELTVTIPAALDADELFPIVEVYHLLDTASAIDADTLISTDEALMAVCEEEVAAAATADVTGVAYEYWSNSDGVIVNADGSISFTTESFSDYYVSVSYDDVTLSFGSSGMGGNTSGTEANVYVVAGTVGTATVRFPTTADKVENATKDEDFSTIGEESTFTYESDAKSGIQYVISIDGTDADAIVGAVDTYTFSVTGSLSSNNGPDNNNNSSTTSTYTVNVEVISEDAYKEQAKAEITTSYTNSTVGHIQIDKDIAIAVTGTDGTVTSGTLSFDTTSSNFTGETIVNNDDGSYTITYTEAGGDKKDVKITIEILEEDYYQYYDGTISFEVEDLTYSTQQAQLTFEGSFPVGTRNFPIVYRITIETTYNGEKIILVKDIHYWHADNECPGFGNGWASDSASGQAGIDIGKMGGTSDSKGILSIAKKLGAALEADTTFTFNLYRVTGTDSAGNETLQEYGEAIEIPIEKGATTGVTITLQDVPFGTYKIVEVPVSVENHDLTITYDPQYVTIKKDDSSTTTNEAIGSFVVTNSYQLQTGDLVISKTVVDADKTDSVTPATDKEFTFTVNLTDEDNNALSGEYSDVTFTNGVGTVTLKGGESKTIEGLPVNTKYTVTEAAEVGYVTTSAITDTNTTLTSGVIDAAGTDTVAFTNTFTVADLTIAKVIENSDANTADDVFTFTATIGGVAQTVTIIGAGSTTIADIPIGTAYTVTETGLPTGYELTSSANASGKIAENGNTATFTNTYETGKLVVSKTVVGKDADLTKKFTFTVTLTGLAEKQLTGTYGELNFTNGVARFELAHGESKEFTDIPKGARYTVVEAADADAAYTTTMSGDTGSIADVDAEAKFTNTYKYGSLEISKTVVNNTGTTPLTDEFTFEVELSKDGDYAYTSTIGETTTTGTLTVAGGKGTLTIEDGETVVISGIETGTTYTVTETGIPTGYALTSKTGDTGTIVVNAHAVAAFTNTYTVGNLVVTKTVVGTDAPKSTDEFEFTVTLKNTDSSLLSGTFGGVTFTNGVATFKLKDGESKSITGIPTGATYTVVETADVDYDTTKTGDIGTISTTGSTAAFTNTYKYGSLTITKAFNGCTPQAGETFLFKVTGPNNFAMDVVIAGAGSITIEHLPLGTYTVTEDNDWSWRYTSSPASASDEITATENGSVTFTNSLSENKWLDGNAYAENNFNGVNPNPTANSDAE